MLGVKNLRFPYLFQCFCFPDLGRLHDGPRCPQDRFWDRFGIVFGRVFGSPSGPETATRRPKTRPRRPKVASRCAQDGTRTVKEGMLKQGGLRKASERESIEKINENKSFSLCCWVGFGKPRRPQDRPKTGPRQPKTSLLPSFSWLFRGCSCHLLAASWLLPGSSLVPH